MRRRSLLHASITAGFLPLVPNATAEAFGAAEPSVKHVINILLAGGLSQLDSLDPKPGSPASVRGEFQSIQTRVPGVHLSELLPGLASVADDIAVLRGVSHSIGIHDAGEKFLLTGVKSFRPDTPSLGAIASRWAEHLTEVPVYAAIPSLSPNAGELGQRHESFNVLGDSGRLLKHGPNLRVPEEIDEFDRRIALLNAVNLSGPRRKTVKFLIGREEAYATAQQALTARQLRELTELDQEPVSVRRAYGPGETGDYFLLARRLVEAGVRYVNVRLGGWDTHSDNFGQLRQLLPPVDSAFTALIQDLKNRGLLTSTMITLVTEFGRTPAVNQDVGRDHWPGAYSIVLAGGRIRGGQVFGATDTQSAEVVDGRCTPEDLAVTLLQELGITPNETFVPPTGRVLLSEGRFLQELI